jgi:protein-L-isoaspartate(D-aspartate) O-methyltransferase
MASSTELNDRMIDSLVAEGDIPPGEVEAAFRAVPRHFFLPRVDVATVYSGEAIPIKHGADGLPISSSSEPAIMARMLEQLHVEPGNRVLEVGMGSGYNAALLSALVGEHGHVTSVDLDEDLVHRARDNLRVARATNVDAVVADGWAGAPAAAPYDRIIVTVGVWDISPQWVQQLTTGGRLVSPLWFRAGIQASVALLPDGEGLVSDDVVPCGFMRLRGPHAGPEAYASVADWVVCLDDGQDRQIHTLEQLIGGPASVEPAPSLLDGWFTELALGEPAAVQMWTPGPPWKNRQGVLLPDGSGLSVVEQGSPLGGRPTPHSGRSSARLLLTYGSAAAKDLLMDALGRRRARKLADMRLSVRPVSEPEAVSDDTLVRPNHVYRISWA